MHRGQEVEVGDPTALLSHIRIKFIVSYGKLKKVDSSESHKVS